MCNQTHLQLQASSTWTPLLSILSIELPVVRHCMSQQRWFTRWQHFFNRWYHLTMTRQLFDQELITNERWCIRLRKPWGWLHELQPTQSPAPLSPNTRPLPYLYEQQTILISKCWSLLSCIPIRKRLVGKSMQNKSKTSGARHNKCFSI